MTQIKSCQVKSCILRLIMIAVEQINNGNTEKTRKLSQLFSSSSSSYLFIYQVTSYHKKKKLQLPLGLSPKHRNMQFL